MSSTSVYLKNCRQSKTIKAVLDDLLKRYGIGDKPDQLLVAGNGKIYDILFQLQREYGSSLSWVVPFPGDCHKRQALQPISMKVWWGGGLQAVVKAMGVSGKGTHNN